jgi:hypothetical protein
MIKTPAMFQGQVTSGVFQPFYKSSTVDDLCGWEINDNPVPLPQPRLLNMEGIKRIKAKLALDETCYHKVDIKANVEGAVGFEDCFAKKPDDEQKSNN